MAGDWLPMRLDLVDDPAVIAIARATGLDAYSVVGRLLKLWSWANRHLADGHARSVTNVWIDEYIHAPGFAAAMAVEKWLVLTHDGVEFTDFEEWNSQCAKVRLLTAKRQRKARADRDKSNAPTVTPVTPGTSPDRDQRTGQESIPTETPPNPPSGGTGAGPDGATTGRRRRKPAADRKPREPDALFDAVAKVTGAEPATVGSWIAKIAHNLRRADPPYTPEDVAEFGRRVGTFLPWLKPGQRPTLKQLEEHIGRLRADPAPGGGGPEAGRVPGRVYAGDPAAPTGEPARPAAPGPGPAPAPDPAGNAAGVGRGGPVGSGVDSVPPGHW